MIEFFLDARWLDRRWELKFVGYALIKATCNKA
jgi:hypothetical protein